MTHNELLIVHRHENPLPAELNKILGDSWGVCRATPRNRERYTRCITERQCKQAIELALDSRLMYGAGI